VSIQVFQESDGRWRWEYRDDKVGLKSNRTYGDAGSARRAAQIAYPDSFRDRRPASTGGFVGKVAKVLTIVLVIVVWRRRTAAH
jgi:hypothetical protein